METPRGKSPQQALSGGRFQRSLMLIFGLQLLGVVVACMMGYFNVAPAYAVLVVIVVICLLTWLAAQRQWRPVSSLARLISGWNDDNSEPNSSQLANFSSRKGQEVATLARGFHSFASRIAGFNERERNFTRDASHELRSPLTVIKMSMDMLADEPNLSDFGQRSVQRIQRATREMEALVEALLLLARESDNGQMEQDFVVNDVLRDELVDAREMLHGHPVELQFDEPARFALRGSPRVFAVLCWQLIRHASQYTGQGTVVITVSPGAVSVCANTGGDEADPHSPDQQGFEYAIARRLSERFAWPLELRVQGGNTYVAELKFPDPLPV